MMAWTFSLQSAPEANRNTFCFHSGFSALPMSLPFPRTSQILGCPLIKSHHTKATQQHPNMKVKFCMLLSGMLSLFLLILYQEREKERVSRMLNNDWDLRVHHRSNFHILAKQMNSYEKAVVPKGILYFASHYSIHLTPHFFFFFFACSFLFLVDFSSQNILMS